MAWTKQLDDSHGTYSDEHVEAFQNVLSKCEQAPATEDQIMKWVTEENVPIEDKLVIAFRLGITLGNRLGREGKIIEFRHE